MDIELDTSAAGGGVSGTSLTFSYTNSGDIMCIGVWTRGTSTPTATYNGVSASISGARVGPTADGDYVTMLYLVGPATGTHNVVVSLVSSNLLFAGVISLTNAEQTGQPDSAATYGPTTATSDTVTTTTVADNSWLVMIGRTNGGGDIAAGANTTRRVQGGAGTYQMFDSNGAKTPAGSHSLVGTHDSSNSVYSLISVSPASGGGASVVAPVPTFMLMGVGC